ncbi:MAG: alpha/beta fold hydrolase [Streptosporangiaceae bacterium]
MQHRQVTVSGTSIHAVTAGPAHAPALVLLHGWPESWATWRELIPLAAPDHRVVAIDLARSVALWRDGLGFEVAPTFELTGDFAAGLTGRPGARTQHAILLALPGGARRGSLLAYMQDHDGVTLELIQLAAPEHR